jgi:prepilin-type N-terminal cleavage/methylation domain-containing protein
MISRNQKGFTIIELLIVIVVIGILAVIGFVAYGNITKSARDSDRQADASNIAKKAEEGYAKNGNYPADIAEVQALGGLDDKTLNSPDDIAATSAADTAACAAIVTTTNDQYCYASDGVDTMSISYWNESDDALVTINGVNNPAP